MYFFSMLFILEISKTYSDSIVVNERYVKCSRCSKMVELNKPRVINNFKRKFQHLFFVLICFSMNFQ